MSLESLKTALPEYARDLKLNLGSLATEPGLTEQQRAGSFIAAAYASRNDDVIRALYAEFESKLSPEALNATKAAAAIMGLNNIYYRFVHIDSKIVVSGKSVEERLNRGGRRTTQDNITRPRPQSA